MFAEITSKFRKIFIIFIVNSLKKTKNLFKIHFQDNLEKKSAPFESVYRIEIG